MTRKGKCDTDNREYTVSLHQILPFVIYIFARVYELLLRVQNQTNASPNANAHRTSTSD
jgi:hypothetical protein